VDTMDTQIDVVTACGDNEVICTGVMEDTESTLNFSNTVFGTPNPITLNGTFWVMVEYYTITCT